MLAPWKESYGKTRQRIKKQRHYFANKGPSSQSYCFSSSWTIKKAEHQRIDAFELWCWRRLLRVPWTVKRPNQSILKEISPEYSLEGCWSWNSNTLATWCKQLTHLKRPWCWERLKAGGEGGDRGWDGWMASPTQWMLNLSKLRELVMDREAWHAEVHRVPKSWIQLGDSFPLFICML